MRYPMNKYNIIMITINKIDINITTKKVEFCMRKWYNIVNIKEGR